MILSDLADACRKSGLRVIETPGWRNRGHGSFDSVSAVVCHHTATPRSASGDYPSLRIVSDGRSGLPGPLCNLGLGRDGTVYVVAAGYAYHAGSVLEGWMSNDNAIGIEAEADGISAWPDAQMDAYARLCAALCDHYRVPVHRVLGHKEVASPRGRKIDPNFDMDDFRDRIRDAQTRGDDDMPYSDWPQKDRDALAKDVAEALLSAKVRNANPSGSVRQAPVGNMLTNIEVAGDRLQQQGDRIEGLLTKLVQGQEPTDPKA